MKVLSSPAPVLGSDSRSQPGSSPASWYLTGLLTTQESEKAEVKKTNWTKCPISLASYRHTTTHYYYIKLTDDVDLVAMVILEYIPWDKQWGNFCLLSLFWNIGRMTSSSQVQKWSDQYLYLYGCLKIVIWPSMLGWTSPQVSWSSKGWLVLAGRGPALFFTKKTPLLWR